jgi:hypothetical protein
MRIPALVLLLVLALSGMALGQVPELSIQVVPGEEQGESHHVGTPILLQMVLDLPAGYEVVSPPEARELQEELVLRVTSPPSGEARPGGGSIRQFTLELVPLQLGELTFPGVSLPWTNQEGESGEAVTQPLTFTVEAAIEDPLTADPADIRGPAALPVPPRYLMIILSLLVLALAAGLFWWWRRRRRPEEGPRTAVPVDPFAGLGPARWALDALDELVKNDVLGKQGTARYHVRLAEIVRLYLGGQFQIPTLERTTRELLRDAEATLRPLPGTRERLRHVLGSCDLVKFARLEPASAESLQLAQLAGDLVEETRPRLQPQQEDERP